MQTQTHTSTAPRSGRMRDNRCMNLLASWRASSTLQRLHLGIIVLAFVTAIPTVVVSYGRVTQVHEQARTRLITLHRLWELHPEYNGRPETWTRFAARLLTDNQLLRRVNMKYGALAEEIERDYRRDLAIANAEVVFAAVAVWALPLLALYAGLRVMLRGRPSRTATRAAASVTDPRYLPRGADQPGETR
jgi:hypothetical protein